MNIKYIILNVQFSMIKSEKQFRRNGGGLLVAAEPSFFDFSEERNIGKWAAKVPANRLNLY